jgi:hypothetical protein
MSKFKTGDKLGRLKNSAIMHYGIFVHFPNGECWVAENNINSGVQYVTFEQFLNGKELLSVEHFEGTEQDRQEIILFINSKIGNEYNLAFYNCENFANEVHTGISHSSQVAVAMVVLVAVTLLYVVVTNSNKRAA